MPREHQALANRLLRMRDRFAMGRVRFALGTAGVILLLAILGMLGVNLRRAGEPVLPAGLHLTGTPREAPARRSASLPAVGAAAQGRSARSSRLAGQDPPLISLVDIGTAFEGAGAVAWGDYDNDGRLDLAVAGPTADSPVTNIYHNQGNDVFNRLPLNLAGVFGPALAWGDFDGDSHLDLLVSGYTANGPTTRLYHYAAGGFTECRTELPGLGQGALGVADRDNDGQLDLAVAGSNLARVYRQGGATFRDIKAGLKGFQFGGLAWGDFDQDGDVDLVLAGEYGTGWSLGPSIGLYRNDLQDHFAPVDAGIPPVSFAAVAWADYDGDGDLDIAIAGFQEDGTAVTQVYRNDGNNLFTDINAGLLGLADGGLAWADFDNDGLPDLVVTGYYYDSGEHLETRLYRNRGDGTFTQAAVTLPGLRHAAVAVGDYDGDGDVDLALSGVNTGGLYVTGVFRNDLDTPNSPPQPPTNLSVQVNGNQAVFSWGAALDLETPNAGLSYRLRVGSAPGSDDLSPGMADPVTGRLRKPEYGPIHGRLSWSLASLKKSPCYWSVQAIDAGLAGSAWAPEQTFSRPRVQNSTQQTWHVTIQEAIDAAMSGDEIVLGPGEYSGPGNVDLDFDDGSPFGEGRSLTVRGSDPADPQVVAATIINCAGTPSEPHRAFRFHSGESRLCRIAGLTIRGGYAPAHDAVIAGGAILCEYSSPSIDSCTILNCTSAGSGGAVAVLGQTLFDPGPIIQRCVLADNVAALGGGGLEARDSGLVVEACRFAGNRAGSGGAIMSSTTFSPVVLIVWNSLFDANVAGQAGGAICTGLNVLPQVVGCTLANNLAQSGGGIQCVTAAAPLAINSILWGNRDAGGAGEPAQLNSPAGGLAIRYCCIQGWTGTMAGDFNSGADPGFVNLPGPDNDPARWIDNDPSLLASSPCVNAADPLMNYDGQVDACGQGRVFNCRADLGALESPWHRPQADFNSDCHVDELDYEFITMCGTGPAVSQTDPFCEIANLDLDPGNMIDANDFAVFQRCWSGPDVVADPACAE